MTGGPGRSRRSAAPEKMSKISEHELEEHLRKVDKVSSNLFDILTKKILKLSDKVYFVPHKYRIFYYSPKRVFLTIKIMKNGLNLHMFTNAKRIKGVESFGKEWGQKWGRMYVMHKKDVQVAILAIKKSYKFINYCVNNNITTGWYAEAED